MLFRPLPALVSLLLFSACGRPAEGDAPSDPHAGAFDALLESNGVLLNGKTLNGTNLNGQDLSGLIISVDLSRVQLQGLASSVDVQLKATVFSYQGYKGTDFIGATFVGNMGDGARVPLKIQGMSPGGGEKPEFWYYDVAYLDEGSGSWRPACLDYEGNTVPAIPVSGRWDYRSGVSGGGSFIDDPGVFTFACASGAIGKCILAGYRPWARVRGKSLAPYHQACTRLIRADFCGDGRSWTQNGRAINLFDRLGIQLSGAPWTLESYWRPEGAICFRKYNRSHSPVPCYQPSFEETCAPTNESVDDWMLANEIP